MLYYRPVTSFGKALDAGLRIVNVKRDGDLAPGRALQPGQRTIQDMTRAIWAMLGIVFVVLGFIGALLPLMPTTIFLILAAGCFSRSSPRLEAWLLDHPRFGPALRAWRRDGAISRRAKMLACAGMGIGFAVFWWQVRPSSLVDLVVAVLLAASALFVISRPLPRDEVR